MGGANSSTSKQLSKLLQPSSSLLCVRKHISGSRKLSLNMRIQRSRDKEWYQFALETLSNPTQESLWMTKIKNSFERKLDFKACIAFKNQILNFIIERQKPSANRNFHSQRSDMNLLNQQLKMHFNQTNHPIYLLNKIFQKHFTHEYKSFVLKSTSNNVTAKDLSLKIDKATLKLRQDYEDVLVTQEDEHVMFSDRVLGDSKRFIGILVGISLRLYNETIAALESQMKVDLQEWIIARMTKLVISKNVYQIVLSICRYETRQQERRIKANMPNIEKLTPKVLGIGKVFMLNTETGIQQLLKSRQKEPYFSATNTISSISHNNEDLENINDEAPTLKLTNLSITEFQSRRGFKQQLQRCDTQDLLDTLQSTVALLQESTLKELPTLIEVEKRLQQQPYRQVTEVIRTLHDYENPLRKLKVLESSCDLIPTAIDSFWCGLNLPANQLMLDADQQLSILTFCLIKSALSDLPAHLKLIEEFTSSQIQNGKMGQALFSYKAALTVYLQRLDKRSIRKQATFQPEKLSKEILKRQKTRQPQPKPRQSNFNLIKRQTLNESEIDPFLSDMQSQEISMSYLSSDLDSDQN